jgi:hypothetical protein
MPTTHTLHTVSILSLVYKLICERGKGLEVIFSLVNY